MQFTFLSKKKNWKNVETRSEIKWIGAIFESLWSLAEEIKKVTLHIT